MKTSPDRLARIAAWQSANPDKVRASKRAYYHRNKTPGAQSPEDRAAKAEYDRKRRAEKREEIAAKKAAYAVEKREERSAYHKKWRNEISPDYWRAYQNSRRRRERDAQPVWADVEAIRAVYEEAQRTGMHVDHVLPLKGRNVSGLHVAANLQLLPPSVNRRKSNKVEVDHAS